MRLLWLSPIQGVECHQSKIIPFIKITMRKVILFFHSKILLFLSPLEKQNDESYFLILCLKIGRWTCFSLPVNWGLLFSAPMENGNSFKTKMNSTTHILWIVVITDVRRPEFSVPFHHHVTWAGHMTSLEVSFFIHIKGILWLSTGISNLR